MGATARRSRRITDRDIELFTELTGDRNPLHYDEEAARRQVEIYRQKQRDTEERLRVLRLGPAAAGGQERVGDDPVGRGLRRPVVLTTPAGRAPRPQPTRWPGATGRSGRRRMTVPSAS